MNRRTAEVFAAALSLPKHERMPLIERLLGSPDDETTPEWALAFQAEIIARRAAVPEPWSSVRGEMKLLFQSVKDA